MFHINDYEENFRSVYVARGKDYYNRGRVSLEDIYDDRYYFKVVGTHRYNVMIQMDDDKMVHHYFCNCPCDFECKHVCGALEYLKKDNEKEMEKPNSNKQKFDRENFVALYNSSVLLDIYRPSDREPVDTLTNHSIKIEPSFSFDGESFRVSFKIGTKRLYVIKSIPHLAHCIRYNSPYSISSKEKYCLTLDSFEDEKLAKWIIDAGHKYYAFFDYEMRSMKDMPISMVDLDYFIEQCKDTIQVKYQRTDYTFEIKKEPLSLTMEANDEVYATRYKMDKEFMFATRSFNKGYMFFKDEMYVVSIEDFIKLHPLLDFMKSYGILIDKNKDEEFGQNVVPKIPDFVILPPALMDKKPSTCAAEIFLDFTNEQKLELHYSLFYAGEEIQDVKEQVSSNIVRDRIFEKKFIRYVEKYTPYINGKNHYSDVLSEEELFEFLQVGLKQLEEMGIVYLSASLKSMLHPRQATISVGIHMYQGLLHLDYQTNLPIEEMAAILKSMKTKKRYYRMKNGEYVDLQTDDMKEFYDLVDENQIDVRHLEDGTDLDVSRSIGLSNNEFIQKDEAFKDFIKQIKEFDSSSIIIPSTMSNILRDYQKSGYRWLKTMAGYQLGGILADDMGIGKTIQVISLFEDARLQNEKGTSLVICPASLLFNWKSEIERFAPKLRVCIIEGSQVRRKDLLENCEDYDVVITSYDYIRNDIDQYENKQFLYAILDEAQNIKNQETKSARAVKQIHAKHRFALTGTPIENTLAELWSIFDFLMPGYLYNYHHFKEVYENDIVRNKDEFKMRKLKNMVSPFMLRRTKKDVLQELPPKIDSVLYVELNEKERNLYDSHLALMDKELRQKLEQNGVMKTRFDVLQMLMRLRQICCSPKLIDEAWKEDSTKLLACLDYVKTCKENNKKILVFSQFTSLLELLEEMLINEKISYYKLTGETSKIARHQMVQSFQNDETCVFLISLKAGGTGLNLTSAEIVVHLDPWWNVSAQNQATDRAYRYGQQNTVQVIRMISKGTIEEKIMKLQEDKYELASAIVDGNETSITKMSVDDILDLFEG